MIWKQTMIILKIKQPPSYASIKTGSKLRNNENPGGNQLQAVSDKLSVSAALIHRKVVYYIWSKDNRTILRVTIMCYKNIECQIEGDNREETNPANSVELRGRLLEHLRSIIGMLSCKKRNTAGTRSTTSYVSLYSTSITPFRHSLSQ